MPSFLTQFWPTLSGNLYRLLDKGATEDENANFAGQLVENKSRRLLGILTDIRCTARSAKSSQTSSGFVSGAG